MDSSQRTALIVGAGIGGLSAGVALRRAGWRVRVFERSENPGELGFALALAPNAMVALRELGLTEAMTGRGFTTTAVEVRREDGRPLRRIDPQVKGHVVVALRRVLHGALFAAVGPDNIHAGAEAIGFETTAAGVGLRFADGSEQAGDLLVGADGVASMVRRTLHPHEPPPAPSGYCTVRGVAHGVGELLGDLAGIAILGDAIECGVARASENAVYWFFSLLTRDIPENERTPARIIAARSPRLDPIVQHIIAATLPVDVRFDELFVRSPLENWGTGRVTLLGDAAHPVLPHTGQGAAQAMEDAVALGIVLRDASDVTAALRKYEAVRSRRTRAVIVRGPRIARVTTTHNPLVKAFRTFAVRSLPDIALVSAMIGDQRDPHRALRG